MKKNIVGTLLVAACATFFWNCGSDTSNNATSCVAESCIESAAAADFVVTDTCYWLPGDKDYLIYKDGKVTDTKGKKIGSFDKATGTITLKDGTTIENVDLTELTVLDPEKVKEIKEAVEDAKNNDDPKKEKDDNNSGNGSSNSQGNGSSVSGTSSPAESSSSFEKVQGGVADPTGYPVASYRELISNGGQGQGYNTRYWDGCRMHCSQIASGATDTSSQAAYEAAGTVAKACNIHDNEIPVFTIDAAAMTNQYWTGWKVVGNSCQPTQDGLSQAADGAFACTDMAPVAVNDTLSYAFVAGPAGSACGKCYHLQYNGGNKDNQVKATHTALKGKHIIVMASNIGNDVQNGQFDLLVPGGGVGIFDAFSAQTGVDWRNKFSNNGGILSTCQMEKSAGGDGLGYDASVADYQQCIKKHCQEVFADFPNLLKGCNWLADWYMAADNPTYNWEEVECPQYLVDKYKTSYNTTRRNDFAPRSSWADYTGKTPDDLEKAGKYTGDGTN